MANRLTGSKSPYLLQHAANPVDWYPWGAEAFEKAETEDKPVLLSIGYSACHWCHAMAEESFSDPETAELINRHFIPVKVDREERPDVDAVYMNVCRAMTGDGGWPLHLLLTPGRKPFFAGTYYPKEDTGGHMGFKTLLKSAADAWSGRRQAVVDTAGKITDVLNREEEGMYTETISADAAETAAADLGRAFDREYGGFGSAPKFPMPQIPMFLLAYGRKYANAESRLMAEKTLQKIHDGGLCDHVGGGYFRYATDRGWTVPHYEKMLYDNALLAIAFLEAGGSFTAYAEDTLSFMESVLKSDAGGFYSAVSAESAGGEGAYYLWDASEVREILGKDAKDFCRTFHITERSLPRVERESTAEYQTQLAALLRKRQSRPLPDIDRKILTGWNALCAVAFARAGGTMQNDAYTRTAEEILHFIDRTLRTEDGRLLARYYGGEAGIFAFAEDYAYLLWAQLTLWETTGREEYLTHAKETWGDIVRLFWDERGGAVFSARDAEKMIVRLMEGDDGATPPANGVLALCLYKLFSATGDVQYKTDMEKIFYAFGGQVNAHPSAFCFMLYAKLAAE
ncbi:MAG: thioredoxin domain-containing protein [Clostridia bacterium]|nr:thioredoxin domain-containing protein [Clostridia bacterium]